MNAIRHLTPATLVAATLAALVLLQAPLASAAPAAQVVQLPTVHVTASRSAVQAAQVVRLPTVHIVVKRQPTVLAHEPARASAL